MIVSKRFVLKYNKLVEVDSVADKYQLEIIVSCNYNKIPLVNAEHECDMQCSKCKFCKLEVNTDKDALFPIPVKDKLLDFINQNIDLMTTELSKEKGFRYETAYLLKDSFLIYSNISPIDYKKINSFNSCLQTFDGMYQSLRKTYYDMKKDMFNEDIRRVYEDKKKQLEEYAEEIKIRFDKENSNGKS